MSPAVLPPPTEADAPARPRAETGVDVGSFGAAANAPRTAGDLARRLGVSPDRVRLLPAPGTATMDDAVRLSERGEGLFELVDGTLVEKAMGWTEAMLGQELGRQLGNAAAEGRHPSCVVGADGFSKAGRSKNLVRMPDVGVFLLANFPPGTDFADIKVADHPADLAVEVLSESNTVEEMTRKRCEYFEAGTSLVWIADHRRRTVEVWSSASQMRLLSDGDALDGGDVLPGFSLGVSEWFDSLPAAGGRAS